jgi:hypothetical protein
MKGMSGFPKKERQRIIDEYLSVTGRNMFNAGEFIDWLGDNPEHEAYPWFYGMDDATAAREYRIALARRMASGLRIVAQVSVAPDQAQVVQFSTREYPAYVSPVSGRKDGGGYVRFDPEAPEHMAELQAQGAQALRAWLDRYRGAAQSAGVDVSAIEEIAAAMSDRVAQSA